MGLRNLEVAKVLREIGIFLEMDSVQFKPRPPELRENGGEVEAALRHRLPKLIELKDLKGDLQVHSNWTDGSNSIKEMADEAKKIGLEYVVISDHSKSLGMAGGSTKRCCSSRGRR